MTSHGRGRRLLAPHPRGGRRRGGAAPADRCDRQRAGARPRPATPRDLGGAAGRPRRRGRPAAGHARALGGACLLDPPRDRRLRQPGPPGLPTTEARLLRNQADIGRAVGHVYGAPAGRRLTALLRQHILIAVDVLVAAKSGDQAAIAAAQRRWVANANRHRGVPRRRQPGVAARRDAVDDAAAPGTHHQRGRRRAQATTPAASAPSIARRSASRARAVGRSAWPLRRRMPRASSGMALARRAPP